MSFQSEYSGYNEYNNHVVAKDTYIPRVDQLTFNTIEKIHKKPTQPPTKPVIQTAPDTQGNSKRRRTAFTSNQISTLEKAFAADTYITKVKRNELASQLNVTERILKVWFQNRRMKQKREKGANGPKYSNKRSIHSVSDQSETSSMISDASAYSNTNKNIEKIPNDGVVTNAYQNENHGEVQKVQQYVSNSYENKIAGSSTVHHYGGNYNGNYGDNYGYNSNYDSFFDPHIGYNFGSSFDNIFSTIGAPNYYNQPMPPMPNTAYRYPPMNIECNSDQFVGPM